MPSCPNLHQGHEPARPGGSPCPPEAPQLEPLTPGPLPCPHSPLHHSPTLCRTRRVRAIPRPSPPDQHAPGPSDRPSMRHSTPCTPPTRPLASSPPHVAAPARTRAARSWPDPPHHSLIPLPPRSYKSRLRPTSSTTPPPHLSPSPRSQPKETPGAPFRAARPPSHAAATDRLRRRHRHLGASPSTLPQPQAAPESLAAGRCLPWPSLPLPVPCPVGLEKTAVSRRSVDQRPQLFPAQI